LWNRRRPKCCFIYPDKTVNGPSVSSAMNATSLAPGLRCVGLCPQPAGSHCYPNCCLGSASNTGC
jgi:hypothetical protein